MISSQNLTGHIAFFPAMQNRRINNWKQEMLVPNRTGISSKTTQRFIIACLFFKIFYLDYLQQFSSTVGMVCRSYQHGVKLSHDGCAIRLARDKIRFDCRLRRKKRIDEMNDLLAELLCSLPQRVILGNMLPTSSIRDRKKINPSG